MSTQTQANDQPGNEKQVSALKGIVKQVLMIGSAIVLLWLSFRGCDFSAIWSYTKTTNWLFIGLLLVSSVTSHLMRAWRWTLLLKPLSDHPVSLWNSFVAVITGYAVNVAIPRGGEVVRLVSITRSEHLPWAGVLSTMLIDRLLDVALLALFLASTLALLPKSILESMPWLVPGGITMGAATLIGLALLPKAPQIMTWFSSLKAVRSMLPHTVLSRVEALTEQFGIGTRSLTDPISYPAIAAMTAVIWFLYWFNFYCVVLAFGLSDRVSIVNTLIVFTVGSVGVLVPTPGSVGSFHFLVSQALVVTSGISKEHALAFVTVLHLFAFIVSACVPAAICMAIQSARMSKRKKVEAEKPKINAAAAPTAVDTEA